MDNPSDGDEKNVGIFMVSSDEAAISLLRESLEERGYHITVFPDGARLNATLGQVTPGLVIYDGISGGGDYELISRMKADETLRAIPTLVLSGASDMHDLLKILESDADDFIAPPYAAPDHLSLIDSMITGESGRHQHGEAIKQFTIRHDEQVYSVAATSRNLLEYLLSSFEILVSKSAELSCVSKDLREVTGSVEGLKQTIAGQTRDIEALKADIDEKKAKIIVLSMGNDKLSGALTQKTNETQDLKREYEEMKRQYEGLENVVKEEKVRNTLLEERLNASMLELGQQKSSLIAEKNRLLGAEGEISSLKQEKIRSENELNEVISNLNNTITKQEFEIAGLRAGIDSQKSATDALVQEIAALKLEKTQAESGLNETISGLNNVIAKQESEIAGLRAGIDSQKSAREAMEQEIAALRLEKTQAESGLNETISGLNNTIAKQESEIAELRAGVDSQKSAREAMEQEIAALRLEKTQAESGLNETISGLNNTIAKQESEISRLKGVGETEAGQRISAENQVASLHLELEQSQKAFRSEIEELGRKVAALQASLKISAEARETERGLRTIAEDQIPALVPELQDLKTKTPIADEATGQPVADQGKERHLVQQPLLVQDDEAGDRETRSLVVQEPAQLPVITEGQESSREIPPPGDTSEDLRESIAGTAKAEGPETAENEKAAGDASHYIRPDFESKEKSMRGSNQGEILFTGKDWLDLLKWTHHTDTLSELQRGRIIRMGRLIQKDRKLTKSQQEQVREILALVQTLGYRPGE